MTALSDDSILKHGDPLGFRVAAAPVRSPVVTGDGTDIFAVHARAAAAQQKEGVLTEGAPGGQWRLTADEGPVMKGDDIAPFPLAYLIAGVAGDLASRLALVARRQGQDLTGTEIGMSHSFGSAGSFLQSTATASSEAVDLDVALTGRLDPVAARALLAEAMAASPAIAFLREPLPAASFVLTINGRRRTVLGETQHPDAVDPYLAWRQPPRPLPGAPSDILVKPGIVERGEAPVIPLASAGKRLFTIIGRGKMLGEGRFLTEAWIARPGMSHFRILSDDGAGDTAPSSLGHLSAGIAFCYLTQLHRYVDAQKLAIRAPRLVQHAHFTPGRLDRIDTHLFLGGEAPDEMHENLLRMAAHTCFMHAAAAGAVEPQVALTLNGEAVA